MKILNKKTQKEILLMLAANYLIAENAVKKIEPDKMSAAAYFDTMEHLIENTCRIAIRVAGTEGLKTVRNMIESKHKSYDSSRTD